MSWVELETVNWISYLFLAILISLGNYCDFVASKKQRKRFHTNVGDTEEERIKVAYVYSVCIIIGVLCTTITHVLLKHESINNLRNKNEENFGAYLAGSYMTLFALVLITPFSYILYNCSSTVDEIKKQDLSEVESTYLPTKKTVSFNIYLFFALILITLVLLLTTASFITWFWYDIKTLVLIPSILAFFFVFLSLASICYKEEKREEE